MLRVSLLGRCLAAALVAIVLGPAGSALAQSAPQRPAPAGAPDQGPRNRPAAGDAAEAAKPADQLLPPDAVTHHSITVGGRTLAYTARAGALTLTDDQGGKTAEIFYVAYTLDGAAPASRPITFAFNGGPGAGSAYLDFGAIGPRVLDFGDGRSPPAPGGKVIDNPDTWLSFTDLVFLDPVGTGYSHAMSSVKDVGKSFWAVNPDLDSLDQAIRLGLDKLNRFSSPLYLAGESYGGYRAARLIQRLPAEEGIAVTGATMISPVLDFGVSGGGDLNPLPWALRLPSFAAVKLESENKLTPDALAPVEQFALGEFLSAQAATPPDPKREQALYATEANYIGLPEALVARWEGKVPIGVFAKEIHHDQGEIASVYDGSVDGGDAYPSFPFARGNDPIFQDIIAPLTTGFVAYLRDELQYRTDRRYELLNNEVGRKWDWDVKGPNPDTSAVGDLRQALATNSRLKLVIDHGMTDLVTPYMTSRYVIDHLPAKLTAGRVTLNLFPGGHMSYLRPDSRAGIAAAAKALYGTE